MPITNFPYGASSFGIPLLGSLGIPFNGTYFWVDPANGSDGNDGKSPAKAFATLYKAHAACTAGKNDVVFLVSDGSTTGTARLSLANAQSVDSSVSAGTLVWSKNATHLIGVGAPSSGWNRARIAPPSGTYTASTFGSANFVTVSASGCVFNNFSVFNGFSTGGAAQIAWTDTGGRNFYSEVHFGGMADQASADDAGSRSLKLSGGGEHKFVGCTFGVDTVTRGAANASIEFAAATARNTFKECNFVFHCDAGTPLGITAGASNTMERWALFDRCTFINTVDSSSTTMTALVTLGASTNGLILMKDCTVVGITDLFSDATTSGQMFIDGAAPTAATSGLAVAPA